MFLHPNMFGNHVLCSLLPNESIHTEISLASANCAMINTPVRLCFVLLLIFNVNVECTCVLLGGKLFYCSCYVDFLYFLFTINEYIQYFQYSL